MAPLLDDDRLTLVGLLVESVAGLNDALAPRLRDHSSLSPQSFEVLLRLARSAERRLRMSDLAAQTTLTPSGLTRAVDRLEGDGLVRRRPCPTDRRGSFAELTPEGVRRVDAAVPRHLADIEEHLTGVLSDAERRDLEALLRKVRDHVKPGAVRGGDG